MNELQKQRELAKKRRIEILQAEIIELEKKIAEMERELEEAHRQDLTILMYNLPYKAREKHIYQFFQIFQCGKIRDIRIIRDQRSGRSKGVAYVEFYQEESIPNALALNNRCFVMDGKEVGNVPVKIQLSQAEKNRAAKDQKQMQLRQAKIQATAQDLNNIVGPARVQVTGMVEQLLNLTEEDIRQTFEPFGPVETVEIPKDENGKLTGSAFVTFTKGESAKNAIETLNSNFLLNGKQIKVTLVASATATYYDMGYDGDDMNNPTMRLQLMQKLIKEDHLDNINLPPIMHQLGITVPKLLNLIQTHNLYAGAISGWKPLAHPIPQCPLPTKVLILTNMWEEEEIKTQSNVIELKEEVENECRKYGDIDMVWIDQKVEGNVIVVFKSANVAAKVKDIMNNRKFSDRTVIMFKVISQLKFNSFKQLSD